MLEKIGLMVVVMFVVAAMSLLRAFPFMWAWNVAMVHVFGLPAIGWLQSFCLLWVAHQLAPTRVSSKK